MRPRRHLFFIILLLATVTIDAWLISDGTFQLVGYPSGGDATYAATWDSLLHGRFDVAPDALAEAYYRDGHYYTYFGIFPAIVRGLLTPFIEIHVPAVRLTCLLATIWCLVIIYMIGLEMGLDDPETRPVFRIALASLFLASPLVFVSTLSIVYNEAILWSTALILTFYYFLVRYIFRIQSRSPRLVAAIAFFGTLTAIARPNAFLTPFFVFVLMTALHWYGILRGEKESHFRFPARQVVAAVTVGSLIMGAALYVNFRRWNDPLNFGGEQYHTAFIGKPWLWEAYKNAGSFAWDRIPATIENYFLPHDDNFISSWPFIIPSNERLNARSFARHFGNIEPYSRYPLPLTSPLAVFFSLLGLLSLGRIFRSSQMKSHGFRGELLLVAVAGGAATWYSIFTFSGISLRYECDLLPLLALLTFLGIRDCGATAPFLKRKGPLAALAVVLLFSVFVTFSASIQTNVYMEHNPVAKDWLMNTFRLSPRLYERPLPPWEAENVYNEWKAAHPSSNP